MDACAALRTVELYSTIQFDGMLQNLYVAGSSPSRRRPVITLRVRAEAQAMIGACSRRDRAPRIGARCGRVPCRSAKRHGRCQSESRRPGPLSRTCRSAVEACRPSIRRTASPAQFLPPRSRPSTGAWRAARRKANVHVDGTRDDCHDRDPNREVMAGHCATGPGDPLVNTPVLLNVSTTPSIMRVIS